MTKFDLKKPNFSHILTYENPNFDKFDLKNQNFDLKKPNFSQILTLENPNFDKFDLKTKKYDKVFPKKPKCRP